MRQRTKNIMLTKVIIDEYYRADYQFLYLQAFQLIKDDDGAKDILQDFFLDLWQRRNTIIIRSNLRNYASKAVRYQSLQWVRRQQKRVLQLENLSPIESGYANVDVNKVEKWMILEKIDLAVQNLLEQLPLKRRSIFLSFAEGLSYKQIAEKHQLSLNTVKTQMKRTYKLMRSNDTTLPFRTLSCSYEECLY